MGDPRRLDRRELLGRLRPPPAAGGHWVRVRREAMACRFEVTLDAEDAGLVPAARAALDEVDRIEEQLSFFRETSELSRLNRAAAERTVAVGPELFSLLLLCGELHAATGGAFDPTSTPLSRVWGFLARAGRRPEADEIERARAAVGWQHVQLDPASGAVRFALAGLEINLGSVGKGWALDRVASGLRAAGAGRALLSAGGSSQRGWGRGGWPVALTSSGETLAQLELREAALGTSGAGEQHFEAEGRRFGHVIDPRSGWPASGVRSATAIADTAAVADALATAFLVGGTPLARAACRQRPGTAAILALEDEPGVLRLFGEREGLGVVAAEGYRLVVDDEPAGR